VKEVFVLFNSCYKDVQIKVDKKSSMFWDITPYSPLKFNLRFGGACQLHVQGGGGKTSTGLGAISQKMEPHITTAVN
jgi:hypothetical protein